MSARPTCLHVSAITFDGVSYLAEWRSFGADVQIPTVDGRGGSERYTTAVEVGGRSSTFPFEVQLNTSGTGSPTTNTGISATNLSLGDFTAGGLTLTDDWDNLTISYTSPTQDGRGGRQRDQYPNYVGGCTWEVSGRIHIPGTVTTIPAVTAALSTTTADRQLALTLNTGAFTLTGASHMTRCNHVGSRGEIQTYDIAFSNRGAPSAPTVNTSNGTSNLVAKILTGSGTDSLISLAITSGVGIWTVTEAVCTQLTIPIGNADIITASGTLVSRGVPTHASS